MRTDRTPPPGEATGGAGTPCGAHLGASVIFRSFDGGAPLPYIAPEEVLRRYLDGSLPPRQCSALEACIAAHPARLRAQLQAARRLGRAEAAADCRPPGPSGTGPVLTASPPPGATRARAAAAPGPRGGRRIGERCRAFLAGLLLAFALGHPLPGAPQQQQQQQQQQQGSDGGNRAPRIPHQAPAPCSR